MTTARVTSKGRVTIPIGVREKLGIHAGTRVQFVPRMDGGYDFVASTGSVGDIRGIFAPQGRAITLEEMDAACTDAAADRYAD
ncbi:MAG: AbrB/MazE/SpoVT family DNA-binding domain-containing protein [Salinibacterium sp.]|nr:AbrB/MazE/SpoVT family DNA-binding domain-containing protein [Salinibacterium sp.]